MNQKKQRIAIIEPSSVIQLGFKKMFESSYEFEISHCFANLQEFNDTPLVYTPDVLLINPISIQAHKRFTVKTFFPAYAQTIFIAILYVYIDSETIQSFDSSVDIYDNPQQTIRKIKKAVGAAPKNLPQSESADLSDREKEILISIAQGLMNKEIADKYLISVHTVMSHRKNIIRKTGIKTVSGLTMYALFNNLISQSDLD